MAPSVPRVPMLMADGRACETQHLHTSEDEILTHPHSTANRRAGMFHASSPDSGFTMKKTRGGLLASAWTGGGDKGDRPVFALWGSKRYAFDSAAAKGIARTLRKSVPRINGGSIGEPDTRRCSSAACFQ